MSSPVPFLTSLGQAFAAFGLYPAHHPARRQAVEQAYARLRGLLDTAGDGVFLFLGRDVVFGGRPVPDLRDWEWSTRLAEAGVQRLEIARSATCDDLVATLEEVWDRLHPAAGAETARERGGAGAIRFGTIEVRAARPSTPSLRTARMILPLHEEAEAVGWIRGEAAAGHPLPVLDAEAVVRSLAVAMHADYGVLLPLLELRDHDQYATAHALNVSVLAMGLAEWLGLGAAEIRAIGLAGLLFDIGTVAVPREILSKPGPLTPQERCLVEGHPAHGARIIERTSPELDLAVVAAYEHHMTPAGGGYPKPRRPRTPHFASRVIRVCDVYDALRCKRPYRDAWPAERALRYLVEYGSREVDAEIAQAFVAMMRQWDPGLHPEGAETAEWRERGQGSRFV